MRRLALVGLVLAPLMLMGCSKKDEAVAPVTTSTAADAGGAGAAGADAAFCTEIGGVAAKSKSSSGSGMPSKAELDALLAQMKKAQAAAPAAMKPGFTTLMDTFREIAKLGEDPSAVTKVLALVGDPKVQKAADDIQAYTKTACNIDLQLAGGAEPPSTPTTATQAGAPTTAVDKTSIEAVKTGVQAKAAGAAWTKAVLETGVWQYVSGGDSYDWEVQLAPKTTLTTDDALAACKLIGDYLAPLQPGFTVTIKDADGKAIVSRPRSSACVAS